VNLDSTISNNSLQSSPRMNSRVARRPSRYGPKICLPGQRAVAVANNVKSLWNLCSSWDRSSNYLDLGAVSAIFSWCKYRRTLTTSNISSPAYHQTKPPPWSCLLRVRFGVQVRDCGPGHWIVCPPKRRKNLDEVKEDAMAVRSKVGKAPVRFWMISAQVYFLSGICADSWEELG